MNGLELAATVHKLWPATGVLLVGADAGPFGDADEFLAKPYSTDRFLGRVEAIAARMRSSAGVRAARQFRLPWLKPPAGAVRASSDLMHVESP